MGMMPRLARRNIWRHRRRTLLTASAIAFASAILVFMVTLQRSSYDTMIDYTLRLYHGHLQVQQDGYLDKPQIRNSIPNARATAARLRTFVGPEGGVSARAAGFALASSDTRSYGVEVIGVEAGHEGEVSTIPGLIKAGRFFLDDNAWEAVVGHVLARNFNVTPGQELTLLGTGRDGSVAATVVSVVGIFESGSAEMDRHLIQLPLGTFQDVFSMGDHAHSIVVRGRGLGQIEALKALLERALLSEGPLVIVSWEELIPGLKQVIQMDWASGWFLYASLIVIVTFSIMNTFIMSVLERTREFGIMLALGARPGLIVVLVLLESMWITVLGLAVGMIAGIGAVMYFHVHGFSYPGMEEMAAHFNLPAVVKLSPSLLSVTLGPCVILFVTWMAALYPALRIRRLKPADAMKAV